MKARELPSYSFRTCPSKNGDGPIKKHLKFIFKVNKRAYIVNADLFENDLYFIKFYLKSHSGSPLKYNLITNYGRPRQVLETCVNIGKEIFKDNKNASFGFIGSPKVNEFCHDDRLKSYNKTKRFQTYRKLATLYFGPSAFTHEFKEDLSLYLILNNKTLEKNPDLKDKIIYNLKKHFKIEEVFPTLDEIKNKSSNKLSGSVERGR